jgi:hypothetical protein
VVYYFWPGGWISRHPEILFFIMSNNQALIEHILNKSCPYLVLGFLLFYNFNVTDFSLYGIIGSVIFIDLYSCKIGRAMGEYENNPNFRKHVDECLEEDK